MSDDAVDVVMKIMVPWMKRERRRERWMGSAISGISIAFGGCFLALLHWVSGDQVFEGGGASMFWALVIMSAVFGIVDAIKWYRSMRSEER